MPSCSIQKALENLLNQHLDSEFKWKLKFDAAAVEQKQLVERLRGRECGVKEGFG
ncbi:hypothetical protein BGS_0934 [Beggiatoa sp. SS]|nr:hypothetical protein BGS_0934 [Beggiatoa sp. SS]